MKIFVLLCLLFLGHSIPVTFKDQCKCSKFPSETTCLEQINCIWNTSICQDRSCSQYYNKDKCNAVSHCSWNISNCREFTKCTDYFMNDPFDCYKIGNQDLNQFCMPTENGNYCKDYELAPCGNFEDDCSGFQSQWNLCYWYKNTCNVVDIRYCDTQLNEELCFIFGEGLGCQWKDNKCQMITCSDYTTESTCILQRQNFIEDGPLLCMWDGTKCIEAKDVSHLDYSNCLVNSFYNYIWDSTKGVCVSCKDYTPPTSQTP
ncbi:unnamed protein product [Paramecium pentaurelia]|uniref:Uncharacterized protein n=1 Tax=Paramecium pentaurelia TaxID=43138 RepID=A0A8S1WN00_9CILI|nr:unnamed protein product [Paramecium pentaurelia]